MCGNRSGDLRGDSCVCIVIGSANHDLAIFTTGVDAKISKFAETTNGELSVKTS